MARIAEGHAVLLRRFRRSLRRRYPVIDTIAIKPGPFAMIDCSARRKLLPCMLSNGIGCSIMIRQRGYPARLQGQHHRRGGGDPPVVDLNYRGKWLQLLFTVDDPNVFTTLWSATVTYGPQVPPDLKGFNSGPKMSAPKIRTNTATEEDVQVPTAKSSGFLAADSAKAG